MQFPDYRPRRMRRKPGLRRMIRENQLSLDGVVYPLVVVPGQGVQTPVASMPGQFHYSIDRAVEAASEAYDLGIPAVLLSTVPERKDAVGSEMWSEKGIAARAVRAVKKAVPDLAVIADVCFREYTDHGQSGVVVDGEVDNDASLENLARASVVYADAGVDIVAPSGMLDGFVGAVREALDESGHSGCAVMAYSAKYASGYYSAFRLAVDGGPREGDPTAYQMDPANAREALREVTLDIAEGVDIVMVQPALAYMDVIRMVADEVDLPVAAYNVSGEYAMLKAAGERGWIDYDRVVMENLTGLRRAGAEILITYHAKEVAQALGRAGR